MIRRLLLCFALAVAATCAATASAEAPIRASAVRLELVGRFTNPVFITAPGDDPDRLFVVERPGSIRVVRDGEKLSRPFLDIRSKVRCCGEQGLLSMAFAPDYASSGLFYVFYTERPSGNLRVIRYRVDPDDPERALTSSARGILTIGHRRHRNHNGGQLQFGPDARLYISTGDGGGARDPLRNGQNRRSLLGKILRIDVAHGGRVQMYAYGLRNPYRFSFDRSTGDMTIGDVGQDAIEEIDFLRRGTGPGANFGWSVFEGTRRMRSGSAPGARRPSIQHSHSAGWCAIVGGYVVRDPALKDLVGRYVYGDWCKGLLYTAKVGSGRATSVRSLGLRVPALSGFGEDSAGRVYAAGLGGAVYRLRAR